MNSGISFSYPWWCIIFCIALGAAYALGLYYRDRTFDESSTQSRWTRWAMGAFRFLAVTILAVLLMSPFIRYRNTKTYKPIIAVLQDNSESIRNTFKAGDSATYVKKMQGLIDKLSSKYDVVLYSFGSELRKTGDFGFGAKVTNISDAIDNVNDLYYNQNLGAVIIASDGIYNQGINPVYSAAKSTYSIYSVALGDTTIPKDLKFGSVYYNKITYLNDQFAVRADVEATFLGGKNAVLTVTELDNGGAKVLSKKDFIIASENFTASYDFIIPAGKAGISHYQLSLTNLDGEVTYRNNVKDIFVEVLDGRQKILLVANSPHPDIAALKQAIESNKNYQLDIVYAADFANKLNDYNLVILHQLPSANYNAENILTQAKALKKSILFVVGSQTSIPALSKAQAALNIVGSPNKFNDVTAKVSKDFNLFTVSDATQQSITKLPPLQCFFGEFKVNGASQTLLSQRINNVETDYPLWMFADQLDSKIGIIAGEGVWRWRLYDYMQNKNFDAFNEVMNKTVQYLAVKGDKRPFRVNLPKNIFQDNEAVTFDAQLYNANYEMVNGPDVDLKIKSADGKEYPFKFNKTDNYYTLSAGFLPVGSYSYSASVKLGANAYKADGNFSIAPLQLEELRTVADHKVMYQLAAEHSGQMYHANDFEKIADEILAKNALKPILYDTFLTESAINLKWIFFLVLILLSAEWFMRKYLGGY
ncbi:MAG: hypothetical protein JWO03_3365 [Bacteroidetes bacterium]|nr:hypothetical protein [Bacteroidota bacterium]